METEIETLKRKLKLVYDFIEKGCEERPMTDGYGDEEYHDYCPCSECGIVWCSCTSKAYRCERCKVSHCVECRPQRRIKGTRISDNKCKGPVVLKKR